MSKINFAADGSGELEVPCPPGEDPKWDKILTEMGYGEVLEFARVTEFRSWEVSMKGANGEPVKSLNRYVKGQVVRRISKQDKEDVERLKRWILRRKPRPKKIATADDCTMVVFFSDWQLGKREGGGTRATLERIFSKTEKLIEYVDQLRKLGIGIKKLIVCGMGDIVENCSGHYPMQAFLVDAHMRQQRAYARRALIKTCMMLWDHFEEIEYRAVPGNHGEERKDGKAYTHFSDNNDVCIFDQFADVVEHSTWAEGVTVTTTDMDEPQLSMVFEEKGVKMGLAHSHQARGSSRGGEPDGRVKTWFRNLAMTRHPLGEVDILNTGHYHHYQVEDLGSGRCWKQCPSLDGDSFWWREGGGAGSIPGMLCYLLDPASDRGWDWERVL